MLSIQHDICSHPFPRQWRPARLLITAATELRTAVSSLLRPTQSRCINLECTSPARSASRGQLRDIRTCPDCASSGFGSPCPSTPPTERASTEAEPSPSRAEDVGCPGAGCWPHLSPGIERDRIVTVGERERAMRALRLPRSAVPNAGTSSSRSNRARSALKRASIALPPATPCINVRALLHALCAV